MAAADDEDAEAYNAGLDSTNGRLKSCREK
jgi:hypothetical protein